MIKLSCYVCNTAIWCMFQVTISRWTNSITFMADSGNSKNFNCSVISKTLQSFMVITIIETIQNLNVS